jgi:hypothetical protein
MLPSAMARISFGIVLFANLLSAPVAAQEAAGLNRTELGNARSDEDRSFASSSHEPERMPANPPVTVDIVALPGSLRRAETTPVGHQPLLSRSTEQAPRQTPRLENSDALFREFEAWRKGGDEALFRDFEKFLKKR